MGRAQDGGTVNIRRAVLVPISGPVIGLTGR